MNFSEDQKNKMAEYIGGCPSLWEKHRRLGIYLLPFWIAFGWTWSSFSNSFSLFSDPTWQSISWFIGFMICFTLWVLEVDPMY